MNDNCIFSYVLSTIVVRDTFEAENTRYSRHNWSSAVTCLLCAALQTANEPSGSINRSPNGSIKARYGTLSLYSINERDLGSGLPCGG